MDDKQTVLTDANAIIARHFADDPANAVRAQQCVTEVLAKLPGLQPAASEADPYNYKGMFEGAVRTLADIDKLLGLPEDGCNDPQATVSALTDLIAEARAAKNARDEWVDAQYAAASEAVAVPMPEWRPFALTLAAALDRGDDPALLMDENSPLRDELRRLLADDDDKEWCDQCGCGSDRYGYAHLPKCIAAPPSAPAAEPLFWYRPRSDGGYEGPIHNDATEPLRKTFWVPLFPGAPAAEPIVYAISAGAPSFDDDAPAAESKPARECRHCGMHVVSNPIPSKAWYPLAQSTPVTPDAQLSGISGELDAQGDERIGRVEIVDGRVKMFAFEQTDTPTGSYEMFTRRAALSRQPSAPASAGLTSAARDVLAERRHQVQIGYDAAHDDDHDGNEIAAVAAFYVMPPAVREWPAVETGYGKTWGEAIVPHDWHADTVQSRRRQLVMGAAMALAEIERLDRAAFAAAKQEGGSHE